MDEQPTFYDAGCISDLFKAGMKTNRASTLYDAYHYYVLYFTTVTSKRKRHLNDHWMSD